MSADPKKTGVVVYRRHQSGHHYANASEQIVATGRAIVAMEK
jgi:hypothetical protein